MTFIQQRRLHIAAHPERYHSQGLRTALGVIQQLHCNISVLLDCVSYLLHRLLIRVWSLQKPNDPLSPSTPKKLSRRHRHAHAMHENLD
jgi:hypothetical protein